MTEFEIICFEGALPLRFGMSPEEVASIIGQPRVASPNWQGVLSWSYDSPTLSLNIGFGGDVQTANHFGFGRGSIVRHRGLDFFADRSAWRRLIDLSCDLHECLGFLVFCDLGIALTGFHDDDEDDLAVVAFPRGEWEEFRGKFKQFQIPSDV